MRSGNGVLRGLALSVSLFLSVSLSSLISVCGPDKVRWDNSMWKRQLGMTVSPPSALLLSRVGSQGIDDSKVGRPQSDRAVGCLLALGLPCRGPIFNVLGLLGFTML